MTTSNPIEKMAINAIRVLSIDMVEKANSGHPGMPMGAAPMAYVLWTKFMRHNPDNPQWFNRDRFVLSAGHGSAMLYSLLHLTGYDLPMEELKQFRQWGSRTPGHPEFGHTPGVEATTGPLGQGISMAVGMAMAERHLAAKFNRENFPVVDHYTYVIASDGDLMEGVAAEAASLAGHLKLGKLIVLYDSNDISLDGDLALAFSEDVKKRFEAYGWHVLKVDDEDDLDALSAAIREAQAVTDRPSLIEVKTTIGYGSPNKAGTHKVHGAPLGAEEAALVRKAYGWPSDEPFFIPEEVRRHFAEWKENAKQAEAEWNRLMESYREAYPELAAELDLAIAGRLPEGWDRDLPVFPADDKGMATRKSSGEAINALAKNVPTLFGGSADLASSNNTTMKEEGIFGSEDYTGRNVWFGVREHGMGAALNGMALHGGVRPYGATFLVFSDYLRPSIRLAALMQLPVTYVFTHDSIAVGEDGPTHEPIEQIPSLRLIPGLKVIRPADANETMAAWRLAMEEQDGPTALILTRQNLPVLEGTAELAKDGVRRGAYVLSEAANGRPQAILIATGSEVSLAVRAQKQLAEKGIHVRVVSMPCRERFDQQSQEYRQSVLPKEVSVRVAIEAAHPMGWDRYVGERGAVIGVDRFGASAPGSLVMKEYGFTVENVVAQVEQLLG
ncbi:transketolase [Polycladomyces sp. WAk]|uniref:Transketolase n=1 Tax=Polycladomyces zharkentensis TaxID=2807616 RepID=A0ABS2WGF5_9BACL|nr:transketolase [Polycladomyces sp. WAk]MBN2908638.1 transketolase [Polycladomyces sp. WAk]